MLLIMIIVMNDNCDGNSDNDSDNDILQASAFSVPPQQFISSDGGIVEMGAEVYSIYIIHRSTYNSILPLEKGGR